VKWRAHVVTARSQSILQCPAGGWRSTCRSAMRMSRASRRHRCSAGSCLKQGTQRGGGRNRTPLIPVCSFCPDTHHVVSRYSRPPEILRQSSTNAATPACAVRIARTRCQRRRLRKSQAQESQSTCRRAGAPNRGAGAEGPTKVVMSSMWCSAR
jgi:hypothetical protein